MVGNGWHWLAMVDNGWQWLAMVGNGWQWLAMVGGSGSFWSMVPADSSSDQIPGRLLINILHEGEIKYSAYTLGKDDFPFCVDKVLSSKPNQSKEGRKTGNACNIKSNCSPFN